MSKCCRSNPRCANCPVVLLAAARRRRELGERSALVAEILAGQAQPLPPCVAAALAELELARATRPVAAAAPAAAGTSWSPTPAASQAAR